MLQPARRKYRKEHKGRNRGIATRGNKVSFGEFGLKATTRGRLTARQIEAARRAMSRQIKRGGRIWIRIFPDKPVSQKPAEVRMGNGKGNPEFWVSEIKPGAVLYESTARGNQASGGAGGGIFAPVEPLRALTNQVMNDGIDRMLDDPAFRAALANTPALAGEQTPPAEASAETPSTEQPTEASPTP